MKVLVADIVKKIPSLPANVRDLVELGDPGFANVRSKSEDAVYLVHIQPHKDDPGDNTILNATCPCDARSLCWHVVGFYAIAKNLLPLSGFMAKTPAEKPSERQHPAQPSKSVEDTAKEATDDLTRLTMNLINAFGEWAQAIARRTP